MVMATVRRSASNPPGLSVYLLVWFGLVWFAPFPHISSDTALDAQGIKG